MSRGAQARIAVAGVRQAALVQVIEEGGGELRAARRAKAHGAGHAAIERDAVVAPAGWQVEQVARLEQVLLFGAKAVDQLERRLGHQAELLRAHEAPDAP